MVANRELISPPLLLLTTLSLSLFPTTMFKNASLFSPTLFSKYHPPSLSTAQFSFSFQISGIYWLPLFKGEAPAFRSCNLATPDEAQWSGQICSYPKLRVQSYAALASHCTAVPDCHHCIFRGQSSSWSGQGNLSSLTPCFWRLPWVCSDLCQLAQN